MWKMKFEKIDGKWYYFSKTQKDVVESLCVLSFGAGIVFGLFVAWAF